MTQQRIDRLEAINKRLEAENRQLKQEKQDLELTLHLQTRLAYVFSPPEIPSTLSIDDIRE